MLPDLRRLVRVFVGLPDVESATVVHPLGISTCGSLVLNRPVAACPRIVVKFFRCLPGWLNA